MLEVNAIYFVLLVEGFGLLLFLVLLGILFAVIRMRRKGNSIRRLARRFAKTANHRRQQTEAFLQAVYRLEQRDLQAALENIELYEGEFFQLLIDAVRRGRNEQIDGLDDALEKLIESYKCLQPRAPSAAETGRSEPIEIEQMQQQVETLRSENAELRDELNVAQTGLNDMLAEFGNMFGGGKDHELDLHDLKKKLAALQAGAGVDIKL